MTTYVINEGKFTNYNDAAKAQKKKGSGYVFKSGDIYTIRIATFLNEQKLNEAYSKCPDKVRFWTEIISR